MNTQIIQEMLMEHGVLKNEDASKLADKIVDVALDELKERTRERDEARKACAELKDALLLFGCETCNGTKLFTFECQGCLTGEGECTCASEQPSPCPQCQVIDSVKETYAARDHALSSDCGKDYVPRSKLDAEMIKVRDTTNLKMAIEETESVLEETKRELLDAKAEVERLRALIQECVDNSERNYIWPYALWTQFIRRAKQALGKDA